MNRLKFKNKRQYAEAVLMHRVLYSEKLGFYACFDDQMGFILINKHGKLCSQERFWNLFPAEWIIVDLKSLDQLPGLLSELKLND